MDPAVQTTLITGVLTLTGVALGAFFQARTSKSVIEANDRNRMMDLYHQWIKETERTVEFRVSENRDTNIEPPVIESQIKLFEKNKKILKKMDTVYSVIGNLSAEDTNDMNLEYGYRQTFSFPEFRESIDELIQLIKKSY